MGESNPTYPTDRATFRQQFGYEFPYNSDDEFDHPIADDEKHIREYYANNSNNNVRQSHSSYRSSGTRGSGSFLDIMELSARIPNSPRASGAAEASPTSLGVTNDNNKAAATTAAAVVVPTFFLNDHNDDLMDLAFKGRNASFRSSGISSDNIDKSCGEPTVVLGAFDQQSSTGSSNQHRTGQSSAGGSTFFFGNLSTSDEGTNVKSHERIDVMSSGFLHPLDNLPTTIPTKGMSIDLQMMTGDDNNSVRSALTGDHFVTEETRRKKRSDKIEAQPVNTDSSNASSFNRDESERSDVLPKSGESILSGRSTRKSICSSHNGSFMAWPDSEGEGESSLEEEESKGVQQNEATVIQSENNGAVVCDFPADRSAFIGRSSSHCSTSSSQGNNSIAASGLLCKTSSDRSMKSNNSTSSSTSNRKRGRRSSAEKRHLRRSLETIESDKSLKNSFKNRIRRASLSDSIQKETKRKSTRHSIKPNRRSLTELHDATSNALPLMGWDENSQSDSSSLVNSHNQCNDKKLASSLSSTGSQKNIGGAMFYDEWVTRSSFVKGGHASTSCNDLIAEDEFDSRKPWIKAPVVTVDRRGSAVTLGSIVDSLDANALKELPHSKPEIMRASIMSLTSTLGDDSSVTSDLTELVQAQEALSSAREDNVDESERSDEFREAQNSIPILTQAQVQLEPVPEEPKSPKESPLLIPALETVDEEDDNFSPGNFATGSHLVDSQPPPSDDQSKRLPSFLAGKFMTSGRRVLSDLGEKDDDDTYSDINPNNSAPSLGQYMSVHNHDIERQFNTTEMENIDYSHNDQNSIQESEDLDMFIQNQSRKTSNLTENDSSNVSGKTGKRSLAASRRIISNKFKPIKDRVKKSTGSNHVRRRNKRMWKFCVWNCRKITLLIMVSVCVLAGVVITFWYTSRDSNSNESLEKLVGDQQSDDQPSDYEGPTLILWPPVGETGRNPALADVPTTAPSLGIEVQESNGTQNAVLSTNSPSFELLSNRSTTFPSIQPTATFSNNSLMKPSIISSIMPPAPSASPELNQSDTSSPVPLNNATHYPSFMPVNINISFSPSSSSIIPSASSFSPELNQSDTSSPGLLSNATRYPSFMPININTSFSPSSASSTVPTILLNSSLFFSSQIIAGEDEFQYAGASVSMTPTGSHIVIGMKEAYETGMVRVYARDGDYFSSLGADSMFGELPGDEFGSAVAISDDGTRVVVGARSSSSSGKRKNGVVKVYQYSKSLASWLQIGDAIEGLEDLERFGFDVDISSDGLRIACASPKGNGGRGSVSVYDFNPRVGWNLVGEVLVGTNVKDMAGFSVSLSSDGSVVAVGAISASLNGLERCGSVTVYTLDANRTWVRSGQVLTGIMDNAQFGYSLELSGDGKRLVVGSNGYSTSDQSNVGSCEVFEYNQRWAQIGAVFGDKNEEEAGYQVSISSDGKWVACSKKGVISSTVVVATEGKTEWTITEVIEPYFENSTSYGSSTAMSTNGEDIAVGAPLFNTSAGFVELLFRMKN